MVDLDEQMKQAEFGDLVGVSQQHISELCSRGILTFGATGWTWLLEYCGNLREVAAGRLAAGDLDLAAERARLAKEQADKVGMQNAVTRGDLAPTYLIEEVLAKAGAKVGGILDAIPGQIRRRVPGLSADDVQHIQREIAKARNFVAEISLDDLKVDDIEPAADVRAEIPSEVIE